MAKLTEIFEGNESPSQFMKARRPELFSDSTAFDEAIYPRSTFDHFLQTLTSRNEERLFETFARRLAEREICPNLVPQTGPVGGGDSKVDSETYPVAEELASTWYHNGAVSAAREKWAFAISAKRDWRPKVQSDVRKIAATARAYTCIFFITSQYVPDKARGELQDALSLECGAKVTILDRTWILEKTYANGHLDIAFEVFSIMPESQRNNRKGPNDAARETELSALESRIADISNYSGSAYRRAEDALDAALVARALGRNETEVDGRFTRAIELLGAGGVGQIVMRFRYLQAWTRFWWFDDAEGMERLYDVVAGEATKEKNAWHLERVLNLWYCLLSATKSGALRPEVARLEQRSKDLQTALSEILETADGSTNCLFARSQLVFLRLAERLPTGRIDDLMIELREIVSAAAGHIDFPMDSLSQMLHELASMLGDSDDLDGVLDEVIAATEPRLSNAAVADTLIERAQRKLHSNKPYHAITLLGHALRRLQSTEERRELIVAMGLLAAAYERVGLLWASRGMLIRALERAIRPLREQAILPEICAPLMRRLCWIEIQLGRPSSVIRAVESARLYQGILGQSAEVSEQLRHEELMRDAIFGILILRSSLADLAQLRLLPDTVGDARLDLQMTRIASLYALGYEDAVAYESRMPKEELATFYDLWTTQPAAADLPSSPIWHHGRQVTYKTYIVGCEVQLEIDVASASVVFAESVLAAIEAYAATAMSAGLYPAKSLLKCRALALSGSGKMFDYRLLEDDCGDTLVEITFDPDLVAAHDELKACSDEFIELVSCVVHTAISTPSEAALEKLIGEGEALTRAALLLGLPIVDNIVFGNVSRLNIAAWAQYFDITANFQLLRTVAWNHGRPTPKAFKNTQADNHDGDITASNESLKHTQLVVGDIINSVLWDRAKWSGTVVFSDHDGTFTIGLLFQDPDAGRKIFRGLRKRVGPVDIEDYLQLSVITDIDAAAPHDYRVLLAPNWAALAAKGKQNVGYMLSRTNTMNTQNTTVLNLIRQIFDQKSSYMVAPAFIGENGPEVQLEDAIQKHTLTVIPAWSIAPSSRWLMGLRSDDNPLIPPEISDPPVKAALAQLNSFEK